MTSKTLFLTIFDLSSSIVLTFSIAAYAVWIVLLVVIMLFQLSEIIDVVILSASFLVYFSNHFAKQECLFTGGKPRNYHEIVLT